MNFFTRHMVFDAANEGGGAAAAAATASGGAPAPAGNGSGGAPAPSAGQATGGEGGPSPYRPDGLPDHFFGGSDKETIDKLFGANKGYRDRDARFAEMGQVPTDAKGYKIELVDTVKPYIADVDNDPVLAGVREAALKRGIPDKQLTGFLNDVLEGMLNGGMMADAFNPETERAALVPDVADPAERAKQADAIVRENAAWLATLKDDGLPEAAVTWLSSNLDHAAANQIVKYMQAARGEQQPALGGTAAGAVSKAQLDQRVADPRGQIGNPKFDPAFAAATDAMFKQLYPG